MTARPVPKRHWRSYGNAPLPLPAAALAEPFAAFPRGWGHYTICPKSYAKR
jgi:hypothetical protein